MGKEHQECELLAKSCVSSGAAQPVELIFHWEALLNRLAKGGLDLLFLDQACIPSYDQFYALKELLGDVNLVLMSSEEGTSIYQQGDSFGQLKLPADPKQVSLLLKRLKQMILFRNLRKRVVIRTFGHFDLYVDRMVMVFPNSRSKELLAMLVDRQGGIVTIEEMIEMFWPEEPLSEQHKVTCRKAMFQLYKTLQLFGVEGILIFGRSQRAIAATAVECDYYRYLEGDPKAIQEYNGDYMREYSWAEETNGKLYHLARLRQQK
jgi:two-component system LytT family response regulator